MATIPLLSDEQWAVIEPLLPPVKGAWAGRCVTHRPVVEGAIYRLKAGIPWRYLPAEFGAWQTVHRRHHRWSRDGTWDRVLAALQADADAAARWTGGCRWTPRSPGCTSTARPLRGRSSGPSSHTGGSVE